MKVAAWGSGPLLAVVMWFVLQPSVQATVLGIKDAHFTIDSRPTFLLELSYFSGLGVSPEAAARDIGTAQAHGFNCLRVWADWSYGNDDMSAIDSAGAPRDPFMNRLTQLVAECDKRGIIVDVTLSRGKVGNSGGIPNMAAHLESVRSIIKALANHRNWYLDLGNEHDVRDARYVAPGELRELRDLAKSLAPWLCATASFGGHDLSEADLREALAVAGLDFVAPHRTRNARSPGETEKQTQICLDLMKRIGHTAPIMYQEPFRRGYGGWQPRAEDFAADLQGARSGGAAGWCFHTGASREAKDGRPRRSFDLRDRPLFDQLDSEERRFLEKINL